MTKEEVKTLESLYNKFLTKCEKICEELDRWEDGYGYCKDFIPMGDEVYCHGHEYWSYGGHAEHKKYFPKMLLTYTQEEVKNYVDNLLTLEKQKREELERLEKEKEEEKEMAEYQRLKEKFERNQERG